MNYENFIATADNRVHVYDPCCIWQCAFQTFGQTAENACLVYNCKKYC